MRFILHPLLALLATSSASSVPQPQHIFSNPSSSQDASYRIPTIHESAVQARRILRLSGIGTLSTIFPSSKSAEDSPHSLENRPSTVAGTPIGLMDYYADCEPHGNPTVLAITIATSFKNVASGSNITLSLRWQPPDAHSKFYSAAALPRFSLIGHLEDITDPHETPDLVQCFVRKHPDAAAWLPGNPIHTSKWVRLVVEEVYWIGGFGDRAYIGWVPVEEWRDVTSEEIEGVRLPGEQSSGWRGWLGLGMGDEGGVTDL
ncbi:hypothetical protein GQ43DRAFT_442300 [Delitschia confertaspora ATCC 74209]|uniref:CREG-like beta-barrel domain-containing protein n=1 Tax=Delitschia confertaspora ATCC 74209 TaxID=1513339 RepID=A0A9P4JHT2_9PLEO|nr:hypothetical protein GQ43DRAFT_442300 [Delitschia confertaspora ATCC 74209]